MRTLVRALTVWLAAAAIGGSAVAADRLAVSAAWSRATPPGLAVGAAYLSIVGGPEPDKLLAARCEGVGWIEFHEVSDDGVARMRAVTALEVPAGARIELAPNGLHLMLIDLERPLVAGETRTLTLEFERAGPLDVDLRVLDPTAVGDAGHSH
jgi:copper(I)-binding protein